jgi:hypothetical protein
MRKIIRPITGLTGASNGACLFGSVGTALATWVSGGGTLTLTNYVGSIQIGDIVVASTASGIPVMTTVSNLVMDGTRTAVKSVTVQCQAVSNPLTATNSTPSAVTFYRPENVGSYPSMLMRLMGTWAGTVQVRGSVDGSFYSNLPMVSVTGTVATSVTAVGLFNVPLGVLYMAVLLSPYTSGTVQGAISLSEVPIPIV